MTNQYASQGRTGVLSNYFYLGLFFLLFKVFFFVRFSFFSSFFRSFLFNLQFSFKFLVFLVFPVIYNFSCPMPFWCSTHWLHLLLRQQPSLSRFCRSSPGLATSPWPAGGVPYQRRPTWGAPPEIDCLGPLSRKESNDTLKPLAILLCYECCPCRLYCWVVLTPWLLEGLSILAGSIM